MPGRLGETNGVDVIRLHPQQSQAQLRSTLAHELAHIELGHVAGCSGPQERAACELAASWLITVDDLVAAARWATSIEELADELWVDVDTVRARIAGLPDGDRHRLDAARTDLGAI